MSPDQRCDGMVALITGSSRGLGKAIAERLAARGATVALTARTMNPDPRYQGSLKQTRDEIVAAGGQAVAVQADREQRRGHLLATLGRVPGSAGPADAGDARARATSSESAGDSHDA
jgi:citronellol/citronellal dehydrogenase